MQEGARNNEALLVVHIFTVIHRYGQSQTGCISLRERKFLRVEGKAWGRELEVFHVNRLTFKGQIPFWFFNSNTQAGPSPTTMPTGSSNILLVNV